MRLREWGGCPQFPQRAEEKLADQKNPVQTLLYKMILIILSLALRGYPIRSLFSIMLPGHGQNGNCKRGEDDVGLLRKRTITNNVAC
jgi:hypothetical protein